MSLREHTRDQGWWQAYEEWQEAWNTCQDALRELRREADEVVINRINKNPSLEKEVESKFSFSRRCFGMIGIPQLERPGEKGSLYVILTV